MLFLQSILRRIWRGDADVAAALRQLTIRVDTMSEDLKPLQAAVIDLHAEVVASHTRSVGMEAQIATLTAAVANAGQTDPAVQAAIDALTASIRVDIAALAPTANGAAPATAAPAPAPEPTPAPATAATTPAPAPSGAPTGVQVAAKPD